jgi:hypothetical protein
LYLFVFSWNGIGWLLLLQETGIGDEHARIWSSAPIHRMIFWSLTLLWWTFWSGKLILYVCWDIWTKCIAFLFTAVSEAPFSKRGS